MLASGEFVPSSLMNSFTAPFNRGAETFTGLIRMRASDQPTRYAEVGPEEPIGLLQLGARLLALVNRKLLPKSYGLQRQCAAGDHKRSQVTPAWLTRT